MDDPKKDPLSNGDIVEALSRAVSDGDRQIHRIPEFLITVVNLDCWRHYISPTTGEECRHSSFEAFVKARFPQGLSTDIRTLKNLCRDDPKALDAIDRVTQRPDGGANNITVDNIHGEHVLETRPDGTSKAAALRRLRKDRPDLHAEVLAGNLSAHAAMVDAGFRRRETALEIGKRAFKKMTKEERSEFLIWTSSI